MLITIRSYLLQPDFPIQILIKIRPTQSINYNSVREDAVGRKFAFRFMICIFQA